MNILKNNIALPDDKKEILESKVLNSLKNLRRENYKQFIKKSFENFRKNIAINKMLI